MRRFMLLIIAISVFMFISAFSKTLKLDDISDFTHSTQIIEIYLAGENEPIEVISNDKEIAKFF